MCTLKTETTLSQRIRDRQGLTPDEVDAAVRELGHGCRQHTKGKLRFALRCVPDIPNRTEYERVWIYSAGEVRVLYHAGQDYTAELPRVRARLINFR